MRDPAGEDDRRGEYADGEVVAGRRRDDGDEHDDEVLRGLPGDAVN